MLQRLCIHLIKECIIKHLLRVIGICSFLVTSVCFGPSGLFLFLWLYSSNSQEEKQEKKEGKMVED